MTVPAALGSAHAINFQPTGNGKAAITGDFVVLAKEVNPLKGALRSNGFRSYGDPQSHADGRASHILRPFLGK